MKPAHPLRLAVADDERDVRQFLQELLPHLGHEVVAVAESGTFIPVEVSYSASGTGYAVAVGVPIPARFTPRPSA